MKLKKIVIGLSAIIVAAMVFELYPLQANAQFAAIVSDPVVEANTTAMAGTSAATAGTSATNAASTVSGWLAQAARFVINQGLQTALAALKKRLIDTMTDEIITWINNGGKPQFIQNFSQDVFQPALNQAIGDTVQQILPTLCSPYSFKVNLELSAPQPLSQPSSCTLNSIVANFNAFRENFSQGGVIGYYELLQPQNNQYGVDIMTQDALTNNVQQSTAQGILQTQVNVGFKNQQCVDWKLVNNKTGAVVANGQTASSDKFKDPNNPPPTVPTSAQPDYLDVGNVVSGINPDSVHWVCADLQISTPGRAIAEGLNKALYANLDLAINDPDITNALAMIADAAFNRLIKAGVQGVQGIIRTATTGGGSTNNVTPEQVLAGAEGGTGSGSLGQAISNVSNLNNQVNSSTQATYVSQLNQASSSLTDAATALAAASSTNQQLISLISGSLIPCLTGSPSSTDITWATSTLAVASSTASTTIPAYVAQITSLRTSVDALTNAVQGTDIGQIDQNSVTTAVTGASQVDSNVQALLATVQTNLSTAQTKTTQCQASK